MRFTAAVACWLVAADCAGKATGAAAQMLFAPNNVWLWGGDSCLVGLQRVQGFSKRRRLDGG